MTGKRLLVAVNDSQPTQSASSKIRPLPADADCGTYFFKVVCQFRYYRKGYGSALRQRHAALICVALNLPGGKAARLDQSKETLALASDRNPSFPFPSKSDLSSSSDGACSGLSGNGRCRPGMDDFCRNNLPCAAYIVVSE